MSQHTPGPWEAGSSAIWGPFGKIIAQCPPQERDQQWRVNAALIAAAPETAAERDELRDDKAVLTGMLQQSRATVWGLKARNAELMEIAKENLENHAWKQKTKGFQLPCGCNACVRIRALMAKIEGGK